MLWLMLEAFGALLLLILLVWWTMFSGRGDDRSAPSPRPGASQDKQDRKEDSGRP